MPYSRLVQTGRHERPNDAPALEEVVEAKPTAEFDEAYGPESGSLGFALEVTLGDGPLAWRRATRARR